jgi:anti-anti-sigma factor
MLKIHAKNLEYTAILILQGRIVNGEIDSLRNAVRSVSNVPAVVLDLARVDTIDACGLGVMLELRAQLEARGIRFELANVTKLVSRVLRVTRLDSVFRITTGVEFFPAVSQSPRIIDRVVAMRLA